MPENGTSLISEILKPVKKPPNPSLAYILRTASYIPAYSEKPRTSSLVLIMIIGFDIVDWSALAMAEEKKLTA